MAEGARRRAVVIAAVVCALGVLGGCKRKHVRLSAIPELGYPACGDAGIGDVGVVVARGHIRAGPRSHEKDVVERFELTRTSCGYTFRSRQEWPKDISDVEVRYDAHLTPLWAWKRMTMVGSGRSDGDADVRRYELRTGTVFIKRRKGSEDPIFEKLLSSGRIRVPVGARVGAVIGPGRGVLTAWIKRAKLPEGGKAYELVLDFRAMVEKLEIGTLERSPDQFEPTLGRSVRVYTFFGQETVFADDHDVVIGDLAGMRPSDSLPAPEPPPLPTFGPIDPAHTP